MHDKMMTPGGWAFVLKLAREHHLDDAQIAGLAIGCPAHGNVSMDWDEDGIFCHRCP